MCSVRVAAGDDGIERDPVGTGMAPGNEEEARLLGAEKPVELPAGMSARNFI